MTFLAVAAPARCAPPPTSSLRTYTTSFPNTENPIAEAGNWTNGQTTGLDWGNVRTTTNKAFGTLATSTHDNTAIVTGTWAADQYATSTVFVLSPSNTFFPEVEHRFRTIITAHVNSGYEVAYGLQGGAASYLLFVRWNGAAGDFTELLKLNGAGFAVGNGDVVHSTLVGTTLSGYIGGVFKGSVDITSMGGTVFTTGAPGMGFNADSGGSAFLDQYGYTAFTAGEL